MNVLVRLQRLRAAINVKPTVAGLFSFGRYRSSETEKSQECNSVTSLLKHLTFKIKSTGPITVAEYMREVLTNPVKGYYMHQDMLGAQGDFVTSPELSQIFGELLGIWCISEWLSAGKPTSFQLVELGPGRGTLTDDILRVFRQFGHLLNTCDISVHLVEVSPKLSDIQALNLTGSPIETDNDENSSVYKKGTTKTGLPVSWYQDLQDVPEGYTFYIAHEFFDALPIHKLQKTQDGWREILIDIDPEIPDKLRFVIGTTSPLLANTFVQEDEKRDHVEVCPSAAVIIQMLANRIKNDGGAALIADYGHNGEKMDTFRGFRAHQQHDVLLAPGTADLTADVDFTFLKHIIGSTVTSLGPITQQEFLKNMGIDIRLKILLENSKDASMRQQLIHGYNMLMDPKQMGERFKFFSLFPHSRLENGDSKKYKSQPVAGFSPLLLQ
ncbi:protein arginine methyltransferase NDUFAF7, mitochondrial [Bombina bombina]|uniref:protein arginine methyltransferase NDUFAF7, mitochondrial n=1 Tax=Bombina bombina TaxID=8345 RepID=UPI00235A6B08|nr:protein arginine methyltransferase NDUFAF7, mitochondrial [Bombina bombina]